MVGENCLPIISRNLKLRDRNLILLNGLGGYHAMCKKGRCDHWLMVHSFKICYPPQITTKSLMRNWQYPHPTTSLFLRFPVDFRRWIRALVTTLWNLAYSPWNGDYAWQNLGRVTMPHEYFAQCNCRHQVPNRLPEALFLLVFLLPLSATIWAG